MEIQLKICGITSLDDARYCTAVGADYLGFIQYDKSPRYVTAEDVKEILDWIHGTASVGVFVNETVDAVNRQADTAGFKYVQLHGKETPEMCAEIERPVIKAIHITPSTTPVRLHQQFDRYAGAVSFYLLDTKTADLWGGSGVSFDWSIVGTLSSTYPFFLAGGIGPDNVGCALETVRPYGIDASSRLEAYPGKKDFHKVAGFIETFRQYNYKAVK